MFFVHYRRYLNHFALQAGTIAPNCRPALDNMKAHSRRRAPRVHVWAGAALAAVVLVACMPSSAALDLTWLPADPYGPLPMSKRYLDKVRPSVRCPDPCCARRALPVPRFVARSGNLISNGLVCVCVCLASRWDGILTRVCGCFPTACGHCCCVCARGSCTSCAK